MYYLRFLPMRASLQARQDFNSITVEYGKCYSNGNIVAAVFIIIGYNAIYPYIPKVFHKFKMRFVVGHHNARTIKKIGFNVKSLPTFIPKLWWSVSFSTLRLTRVTKKTLLEIKKCHLVLLYRFFFLYLITALNSTPSKSGTKYHRTYSSSNNKTQNVWHLFRKEKMALFSYCVWEHFIFIEY